MSVYNARAQKKWSKCFFAVLGASDRDKILSGHDILHKMIRFINKAGLFKCLSRAFLNFVCAVFYFVAQEINKNIYTIRHQVKECLMQKPSSAVVESFGVFFLLCSWQSTNTYFLAETN
jgi:hypothetical protein